MNNFIDDITFKIYSKENGNMVAQIEIFYGPLALRGFRILKTEGEKLYLRPPAVPVGPRWKQIIRITDPDVWKNLEEKLINAYESGEDIVSQNTEKYQTIDIDDLPI